MALPSISSLSKTPKTNLGKRLIPVLECDPRAQIPNYPDPTPPAESDPAKAFLAQVATFRSMTSLCGQYPGGMGYYCPPAGDALLVQRPASQLYEFLGPPDSQYLKDACLANCYCTQIAPGDPDPSSSKPASAQCLADVGESDSDDEVDAGGCMDTYHDPEADDGIDCDETGYFYGHPLSADCELAQDGIGDGFESMTDSCEFLGIGAQSVYNGYEIAQTPYNWTSGTCYIQVSMLDGGNYYASSNIENWDYIWGRADAIRQKCVAGLGVGGSAKAGDVSEGMGIPQSIGIFVSGVTSKTKQMLDMKFACITDADGNYSCDDDSAPAAKKQKTSPPSSPDSAVAPPAGNRLGSGAQSGSCVSHTDCDYNNGYTCAATKTAADDFPVDSTWGTYTCKLASKLASNAIAAAAAYVALGSTCRGRCVLDTNGTLDVLANTTSAGPEPDSVMPPMLVGPCNCTYVSAACVLSTTGMVYEDPSAKIDTVVGAPNGTVCCDATTGLWGSSTVVRDTPAANPLCPAAAAAGAGAVQVGASNSGSGGEWEWEWKRSWQ
ncbi:hypothetical protein HO173_005086 [Letharia columbiana]|uniref:Uncharacterized protein n=1 Tax=Letharia columbiana TaxID=112416 RepID=A0A8H6FXQ9_9LECA|nr:uncharacterized protein HO173_005086 [Letharia columbiana]KAF6236795.1 hypothetical protein HO173_005086 [Letharia columbiana]